MVSSHPARVVSTISKPDNMLVVNRVVVNTVVSVARNRERETWTKMRKISAAGERVGGQRSGGQDGGLGGQKQGPRNMDEDEKDLGAGRAGQNRGGQNR